MKKINILITVVLLIFLSSCNTVYYTANINAVGVVVKKRSAGYEVGNFKYLIRIDPETKVWVITNDEFNKGDSVWMESVVGMGY